VTSPPKISVVVPSFNKVSYIERTLNSIISQKYPNLEVIIQDGLSTDGTLEIIKKFAAKYPILIRFESKKDGGQLNAVNMGFRKARGEVVTYINADDEYCPGAFAAVAKSYAKTPGSLWFAGLGRAIDKNGREIAGSVSWYKKQALKLNSRLILMVFNYLMQPSVFISREAYKKFGPFDGTRQFIMEYEMWLKLSDVQMPVVIDKNLSLFRIEPSTTSQTLSAPLLAEDERTLSKYTKNKFIIGLHKIHNFGRIIVGKII
jgi:glycosyltransferase involved in cell wall biosynthesis